MLKKFSTDSLFIYLFFITLTFVLYLNILPNQFLFDDEELVYKNVYVQDLKFLPNYFTENMIAGAGKSSNMYRPALLTSYALDHQIWKNNPVGYHLTSIVLHALNGIVISVLINILFKNQPLSILTAAFFIIHPVQTETITYISGRTDPLSTLFIVISVILFIKSRFITSFLFFILAIFSKETAIILPFLLSVTIIIIPKFKRDFKKYLLIISPFFLLDFVYIILRLTILNFSNTLNFYQIDNVYSANLGIRLFTFTHVFFEYLSVLVFPKDLVFARDVKYITNAFDPWVFTFLITFMVLFFLSIKIFGKNKIFFFSFFWFFITILPVSGIIPINSVISEHYLYLPSLSFFLMVAYAFLKLIDSLSPIVKSISVVFLLIFITAFSLRTIIRNFDWKDAITFYNISLKQSPWHIPMRHNLAMTLADKGEYGVAIDEYKTLISLSDTYPQVHHNLANAYKAIGKYKEAEEEYYKALKMDPKFLFSYYALTELYQKTQELEKLEGVIKKLRK